MVISCYIQIPEQFKCFTFINCGNKSKSFMSFTSDLYKFSLSSIYKLLTLVQAAHTQYKLITALPTALLLKAAPQVLSSVVNSQHKRQKVSVHVWNKVVCNKAREKNLKRLKNSKMLFSTTENLVPDHTLAVLNRS